MIEFIKTLELDFVKIIGYSSPIWVVILNIVLKKLNLTEKINSFFDMLTKKVNSFFDSVTKKVSSYEEFCDNLGVNIGKWITSKAKLTHVAPYYENLIEPLFILIINLVTNLLTIVFNLIINLLKIVFGLAIKIISGIPTGLISDNKKEDKK